MMMLRQIVILLSLLSLSCNATNTLKGKHLKVAFSGLPPFVYTNKDGSYSGIDLNIIPILADKMGFSYTLEWGQFWGSQYPDGGWAGVVGYVKNGSHTIGLGHVLLQMGRFEAVDYALMYSQPHFLMAPRPKPIAPVWNMTRPFTPYVWLGALGTILAVTLFSLVIRPKKGKSTLTGWVLYIFGSQFNQQFRGSHVARNFSSGSSKIFYSAWLLYVFFLLAAYECNLRAYLMKVDYEAPIDTLEDLEKYERKLYLPLGTPFIPMMRDSPVQSFKDAFQKVHDNEQYYRFVKGQVPLDFEQKMIDNKYVLLSNEINRRGSFSTTKERWGFEPFQMGREALFSNMHAGIIMPKNASFKSELDGIVGRLLAAGIVDKFIKFYTHEWVISRDTALQNELEPLGLQHLGGGGICYLLGLGLATISIAFEIISKKY